MNRNVLFSLSTLALLGLGAAAHAQTPLVNVQFIGNTYTSTLAATQSGAAAIGSSGDAWNPEGGTTGNASFTGTGLSLVSTSGGSTALTLDYTVVGSYAAPLNQTPFNGTAYQNLFEGFAANNSGNANLGKVVVHGLTPGNYSIYLYAVADNGGQNRTAAFTVNGLTTTVGPNSGANTLIQGTNYGVLNPVVGADGNLTINFVSGSPAGGSEGDFNGFQLAALAAAPEPSQFAAFGIGLLGLGMLSLKVRRRTASAA